MHESPNLAKKKNKTSADSVREDATASYLHPEATSLLRPDVGTQAQFKKKQPPATYRYDSSLSPELDWDGQNGARELGEWLLARIEDAAKLPSPQRFERPAEFRGVDGAVLLRVEGLVDAVEQLKRLSKPFLNWTGKAERLSFDVPTLPLFVHERLSTAAVLDSVRSKKRDKQATMYDLFGDAELPIHQQVLKAYEHPAGWTNRMVLGDSLVVMNSLVRYEGLGGKVQMIYMDPPYGVKFGSNFQPFVRKRDVKHGDDGHMTREPEMVKAYRDTWELGLHSYLTYMRDRLLLARELLTPSGSVFVQISDENLHHVRELMDEVFGAQNFVSLVVVQKTSSATAELLSSTADFLVWYARDRANVRFVRPLIGKHDLDSLDRYDQLELRDGTRRAMTREEKVDSSLLPVSARRFQLGDLTSTRPPGSFPVQFDGSEYRPRSGYWKTGEAGMRRLIEQRRVVATDGGTLRYVRFLDDSPSAAIANLWTDISGSVQSRSDPKVYAVQTSTSVVERCLLMTTQPGDLVLDPTCGSGTTAYVAEQWGRRWITIDTSRVPLALARQRLLTATFPYYQLKEPARGPAGGFVYVRKQNKKGEEVGGIVPHVTLKSIANNEPPAEEVLVDRPEKDDKITRVAGPFCVEATIPTPIDLDGDGADDSGVDPSEYGSFVDRMIEVLRRAPVLQVGGGATVTLKNVKTPAKTLSLSAEALVEATAPGQKATLSDVAQESIERSSRGLPLSLRPVAIVFGPENGAVSEKLVFEAAREAYGKSYTHLYVIGFAIQPNARELVQSCEAVVGVPATYVQATPDLMMGDLLKNLRSSQIFSVCGQPDVKLRRASAHKEKVQKDEPQRFEVELIGLDVFDPTTMEAKPYVGADVPCWMLDSDYNGLCFHAHQVFFPRTAAWDDLKRSLRGAYDDTVWEHLAGTTSMPFEAGEHSTIAVKVIDDRGNELLVVKKLAGAN